jgi:hypothetical protein
MRIPDIINGLSQEYYAFLHDLGIEELYHIKNNHLKRAERLEFPFTLADSDFERVILKTKVNGIYNWEESKFKLTTGLAERMKQHNIFIIFNLKKLREDLGLLKYYIHNARVVNEYSVPAIFASFASELDDVLSAAQIVSIAEVLGYRYSNILKAYRLLLFLS